MNYVVKYLDVDFNKTGLTADDIKSLIDVGKELVRQAMLIDKVNSSNSGQASDLRGMLTKNQKALEDARKQLVKPYNDKAKEINKAFKEKFAADPAKAIASLSSKIKIYMDAEQRKQRAMEEAALSDIEDEDEKQQALAIAAKKSQTTKRGSYGHKSFTRKVWNYRVIDKSKVPLNYLDVAHHEVKEAIKDGVREIEGLEIYQESILSTR